GPERMRLIAVGDIDVKAFQAAVDGITAKELAQRQQQMVGHYYVSLADTDGMAAAILNAVERGYDLGWLDEYPRAIQALTLEEVNRAIQIHLDPRKMVVIKAGTLPSNP